MLPLKPAAVVGFVGTPNAGAPAVLEDNCPRLFPDFCGTLDAWELAPNIDGVTSDCPVLGVVCCKLLNVPARAEEVPEGTKPKAGCPNFGRPVAACPNFIELGWGLPKAGDVPPKADEAVVDGGAPVVVCTGLHVTGCAFGKDGVVPPIAERFPPRVKPDDCLGGAEAADDVAVNFTPKLLSKIWQWHEFLL